MKPSMIEYSTPTDVMTPIGPYSHVSKAGNFITVGAIAGVDPATGNLAGDDVASQTEQIVRSLEIVLQSVGSNLDHVLHITVFLKDMGDFGEMNEAYSTAMSGRTPPRTAIAVSDLPKPNALLTMNATAIAAEKN